MSSIPGYDLEDFVAWSQDLIVDGDGSANFSLQVAELIGTVPRRRELTTKQFFEVLKLYEPYREQIEDKLCDFDEDNQSWRSYSECVFNCFPESVIAEAELLINKFISTSEETT